MRQEAAITGKRWDFSADGYNDIIQQEYEEVGDIWLQLLKDHSPCSKGASLDIGTGPGFFAMLLASMGWNSTGVDCAPHMIEVAKKNAVNRRLDVDFQVMDSHILDYPDNSFDYLVARNATWLLYKPEEAFTEWLRVLKPGGRLMYIDANWPYVDDPALLAQMKQAESAYTDKFGKPFSSYTGDQETNESFQQFVAFQHILRPDWDVMQLPKLGYSNVTVVPRINELVYPEWKQLLYHPMNLFLITADKPNRKEGAL